MRKLKSGTRGTRAWLVALMGLAVMCLAALPAAARAETWTPTAWTDCSVPGGTPSSGDYDTGGTLYIACGQKILVYDAAGVRQADISPGLGTIYDVATSPAGDRLYVARGQSAAPKRLNRQANGTYLADATWALGAPPAPDAWIGSPFGFWIATDQAENVYISDSATDHGVDHVFKYTSTGTYVTWFGKKVPTSSALGEFHNTIAGIAVTPDGSRALVADQLGNRIQVFDRQAGGSYLATKAFGSSIATYGCTAPQMASPYGVAFDGSGQWVYTLQTSCSAMHKFKIDAAGNTTYENTVKWGGTAGDGSGDENKNHGFAVSKDGKRIYVPEFQKLMVSSTAAVMCNGQPATIMSAAATVSGTSGNDVIAITGGTGSTIDAGAGNDTICGSTAYDTIKPGSGNDVVIAGGATNAVDYASAAQAMSINLVAGTATSVSGETDTLSGITDAFGSSYADTIAGGAGPEFLAGNGGGDTIQGGGGNDTIWGDASWEPAGNDTIDPGPGSDTVRADDGNDTISAQDGAADTIDCGAGTDPTTADVTDALTACEPSGSAVVDVCANLDGAQATMPAGMVASGGNCVTPTGPPPPDVCANIDGAQATVPAGMVVSGGNCVTPTGPPPPDVCTNIDGAQATVPAGMVATGTICTAAKTKVTIRLSKLSGGRVKVTLSPKVSARVTITYRRGTRSIKRVVRVRSGVARTAVPSGRWTARAKLTATSTLAGAQSTSLRVSA